MEYKKENYKVGEFVVSKSKIISINLLEQEPYELTGFEDIGHGGDHPGFCLIIKKIGSSSNLGLYDPRYFLPCSSEKIETLKTLYGNTQTN